MHLESVCHLVGATEITSDRDGTALHVRTQREAHTLAYVFAGGCIVFKYPTRALAETNEGRAFLQAVGFMTRERLRELSTWEL